MERQKKVIDASVLAKIFLVEEMSAKAEELCRMHVNGEIQIIVPELLAYEIANTIRYKNYDKYDFKKIVERLFDLQLEVIYMNKILLNSTIENALKYDITVYDATYVTLAEMFYCELVTDDGELIKKVPRAKSLKEMAL